VQDTNGITSQVAKVDTRWEILNYVIITGKLQSKSPLFKTTISSIQIPSSNTFLLFWWSYFLKLQI